MSTYSRALEYSKLNGRRPLVHQTRRARWRLWNCPSWLAEQLGTGCRWVAFSRFFCRIAIFLWFALSVFFVSHFALCCNFSATRNHYTACRNSGKMSFFAACSGQLEFSTQASLHKEVKILFPLHTQLAEMHKCANWCRVRTGSMQCKKHPWLV